MGYEVDTAFSSTTELTSSDVAACVLRIVSLVEAFRPNG